METLIEYSYFHGSMVICIDSVVIWTQVETLVMQPSFACNVVFEDNAHLIRYDQTLLRN